jgi:hypothetical protein
MLRITVRRAEHDLVLTLEGCLTGPWVAEVDRCWQQASAHHRGHVRVDLRNVYLVDDAGRELMTRMHDAGAAFMASGCLMPEIVREVTRVTEASRSSGARS